METAIKAIVKGVYKYPNMDQPKEFESNISFTLYPPAEGEKHYGTGCYMGVDFGNGNEAYVDVRYSGMTDIRKLASQYITNYLGSNLREFQLM